MTKLSFVVAIAHNQVIGAQNSIPWHVTEDIRRFKELTMGKPMIMGRRTYDSIGKPLPNRRNIVISRDKNWQAAGVECVTTLNEALILVKDDTEASIIGGAEIFKLAMDIVDCLEVTEIDLDVVGDTFFPAIDLKIWQETYRQAFTNQQGINYSFVTYQRRH